MMKKAVLVLICLVFFCGNAVAGDSFGSSGFGLSLGYGQSKDDIDIYRIGLLKDWQVQWLKNSTGYVNGYFELSYNHWKGSRDTTHAGALSPVFQYVFNSGDNDFYPYIEGGIGVAYLDDYFIDNRNLASNLQFEDRIGIGFRYKAFDLNFRYLHYSNASLKQPNEGIDIMMGTLAWYF